MGVAAEAFRQRHPTPSALLVKVGLASAPNRPPSAQARSLSLHDALPISLSGPLRLLCDLLELGGESDLLIRNYSRDVYDLAPRLRCRHLSTVGRPLPIASCWQWELPPKRFANGTPPRAPF